jgi:predicted HicB family RNase H-like nuclease
MESRERISLHLSKPLKNWIEEQAQKDDRSVNKYIIKILEDFKNNNQKEKIPCILPQ